MPASKKCISCVPTNKKVSKTTKKRADWKSRKGLTTIFPNDKVPEIKGLKVKELKGANQSVEVDLGKKYKGRMLLYYASKEKDVGSCKTRKVLNPEEAYGNFKNGGVAKLDGNGKVMLKIICPRPYREDGITYKSHVHFIVANKAGNGWEDNLLTQTVVCELNDEDMMKAVKSGCHLILNALPFEYYVKDRIPNSLPLDHNLVLDKLSKKEVVDRKLCESVNKKELDLMDIPIITYCYDAQCTADEDLQQKLNKIGFNNVKVYVGGIVSWRKKNKKD